MHTCRCTAESLGVPAPCRDRPGRNWLSSASKNPRTPASLEQNELPCRVPPDGRRAAHRLAWRDRIHQTEQSRETRALISSSSERPPFLTAAILDCIEF